VLVLGLALLGREGLTMGKVADMTEKPPDGPPEAHMAALEPTRSR
jgi:hypothetical protein